jgi:NAD(P)H-hydrate epimerase
MQMMLLEDQVKWFAKEYHCLIILKGKQDFVASPTEFEKIGGGNAGMTKGGTGDVLAGLVAGLYAKNTAWESAVAASFLNKKAGDDLYERMGFWFNASDLADQIPMTMKRLILGTGPKTAEPRNSNLELSENT